MLHAPLGEVAGLLERGPVGVLAGEREAAIREAVEGGLGVVDEVGIGRASLAENPLQLEHELAEAAAALGLGRPRSKRPWREAELPGVLGPLALLLPAPSVRGGNEPNIPD